MLTWKEEEEAHERVTSERPVKAWLDSLNERPGGWRNPVSRSLMSWDGLGARCLWTCKEYGKAGPCNMLQDVKKLGTVNAALSLAQCACVQP